MQKIDGCEVETAASREQIYSNIQENNKRELPQVIDLPDWRSNEPIAIVGGGPSLKEEYTKLVKYNKIMVCGSAHDFLQARIKNKIKYAIICDPDPLVINYLKNINSTTQYLVASQCAPETFQYLSTKLCRVYTWQAYAEKYDQSIFGDKAKIGGGCTIGTRAMIMALGMGYNTQHLFGFDTCLTDDYKHHAYDFSDPSKESIGNILEMRLEGSDKKYKVAGYMMGQLFDFQLLLKTYANRINVEIFGEGLLKDLMEIAKAKSLENKNGD